MADTTFPVPSNSYSELKKIIKGYAHAGKKISLADASKLTGMHRTAISGCNKFLVHLGILSGGANKQSTDFGAKLGIAMEHKQDGEIRRLLAQAVSGSEYLSNVVSAIRIKEGMDEEALTSHILYVAGQKNTSSNKTGARAIVNLLSDAGVIQDEGGKYTVATAAAQPAADKPSGNGEPLVDEEEEEEEVEQDEDKPAAGGGARTVMRKRVTNDRQPNITISINLQLPDTPDAQVYENFFKAMKTYLLTDD